MPGGVQLSAASKVALVGVSSLAISATSIVLRQAEHNDEIAFSPIAASLFGELMKLVVALGMMVCRPGSFGQLAGATRHQALLFLLPAFLYVLTNNLRFFIVQLVNPGLIGVMWNLKVPLSCMPSMSWQGSTLTSCLCLPVDQR